MEGVWQHRMYAKRGKANEWQRGIEGAVTPVCDLAVKRRSQGGEIELHGVRHAQGVEIEPQGPGRTAWERRDWPQVKKTSGSIDVVA